MTPPLSSSATQALASALVGPYAYRPLAAIPSPSEWAPFLDELIAHGQLDLLASVRVGTDSTAAPAPLLAWLGAAWLRHTARGLSSEDIACLDRWGGAPGRWWDLPQPADRGHSGRPRTLATAWLDDLLARRNAQIHPSWLRHHSSLESVPLAVLQAWRDGPEDAALPPGAAALRALLSAATREDSRSAVPPLTTCLTARGIAITVPALARSINRPEEWQAFLEQGGDPEMVIESIDGNLPLWQHLRAMNPAPALLTVVEAWAAGRAATAPALARARDDEYLRGITQTHTKANLRSAVVRRKDWPEVRAANGADVLQTLLSASRQSVSHNPTEVCLELAARPRILPLLARDRPDGFSNWHALLEQQAFSGPVQAGLFAALLRKAGAKPHPNSSGRGAATAALLGLAGAVQAATPATRATVAKDFMDKQEPWLSVSRTPFTNWPEGKVPEVATPGYWLAGSPADQAAAQAVYWGRDAAAYGTYRGFDLRGSASLARLAEALEKAHRPVSPGWADVLLDAGLRSGQPLFIAGEAPVWLIRCGASIAPDTWADLQPGANPATDRAAGLRAAADRLLALDAAAKAAHTAAATLALAPASVPSHAPRRRP